MVYGNESLLGDQIFAEKRKDRLFTPTGDFVKWDVEGKTVIAAVCPRVPIGAYAVRHTGWRQGWPFTGWFEEALIDPGTVTTLDWSDLKLQEEKENGQNG